MHVSLLAQALDAYLSTVSRDIHVQKLATFGECGGVVAGGLHASSLPVSMCTNVQVLPAIGSPREYNYRSKLTPHYEANRGEHAGEPVQIGGQPHLKSGEPSPESCREGLGARRSAQTRAALVRSQQ